MRIGEFLKEQRIRKGFTQEELAAKIDVSVRTIQRIESGNVDPRTYTLKALSEVLEIDYEKLINFEALERGAESPRNEQLWIGLLHLSGLFILVLPPIIIYLLKKDEIKALQSHFIDVINFQISMLIYIIPSSFLVILFIGLPLLVFFGIFSTIVILLNTVRAISGQPYKYPLSKKFLKH